MTVGSALVRGVGNSPRALTKRFSLVAVAAMAVAACGSASSTPTSSGPVNLFDATRFNATNVSWLSANANSAGTPVMGGTLKVEGSTDFAAAGDPQADYETLAYGLERTFARQLVSYPASTNFNTAVSIVPDAASALPKVSSDGLTYTFNLRSGLMWNTSPPRPVTSQDFKRGILRNCDPTLSPNGNPGYYGSTIVGFKAWCSAFEGQNPAESPAARAASINAGMTSVSGMQTPDSSTIVFTLTEPAVDFLNILALPFASAAPVEYLADMPLTPPYHFYSDGPYYESTYNVGHEIILSRNPTWSQSTDPLRHQYVNQIDVKLDLAGAAAGTEVQQDMQAGTADLAWNTPVPTADITSLESPTWNPQFGSFPQPGDSNPYITFNVQSPNNGGALENVKVRQALEYAIDKVAIAKIYGGASLNQPINQVLGPGAQGYVPINDYPTPNNQGNPSKCKTLLAAAGYPNGFSVKYYYRNSGNHPAVFQSVQSDLGKCGVTVVGTPIATGFYGSVGIGVTSPNGLKSGHWDMTDVGWGPDWFSSTNARSILPSILDGALSFPGSDYGGYISPAVDALVTQAEAATTIAASGSLWHQADVQIMKDAPIVPVMTSLFTIFRSARVHNALYAPLAESYDYTQIWLSS
jgi:ABC-type transport system substrate-binding protein